MAEKQRVHVVEVRMTFDKPVTLAAARYAAWNNLSDTIYGSDFGLEPWGEAKVQPLRHPRKAKEP